MSLIISCLITNTFKYINIKLSRLKMLQYKHVSENNINISKLSNLQTYHEDFVQSHNSCNDSSYNPVVINLDNKILSQNVPRTY